MKHFKEKIAHALKWQVIFRMSSQILTWCITIFIVRLLSPEDYGLMGMSMVFIAFLNLFNDIGLSQALIQREDSLLNRQDLNSVFWTSVIICSLFSLAIYYSSPLIANFYNEKRLIKILQALSISFIFIGLRIIPYSLLIKNLEIKKRAFSDFVAMSISSIVSIIAAYNGLGVWSLVLANLTKEITFTILIFIFCPFLPNCKFSFQRLRPLINFSYNITLSRLFWYLYSHLDILIIGKVLWKLKLGY